ncbi:MAG TPA: hypothetical protein VFZ96_09415, partial [Actinomycetota bacterium]|nr:hypothetical protein [Actinomycetota bacterium]
METRQEQTPKAPRLGRGRRRSIVVVAATLAFAVLAAGVVAAATLDRSEPARQVAQPSDVPTVVPPTTAPPAPESPEPDPEPGPKPEPESEPEPEPDPYALEDGVYPTFIRDVDIQGAEITVDVIQVYKHDEAVRAAVQDGMKRR